ncbi:MAG: hypothetical protein KDD33_04245 [Bdellovibrionales bacterium]|nr:hypothetical protein [Bdellovibrionales bacterium]
MKWILFLVIGPVMGFAEYRVFKLKITDSKESKSRIVHSTLDGLQYRDYHHLNENESIEVVDHWMCWKRNDGLKPLCQRPVTLDSLKSESELRQPQSE